MLGWILNFHSTATRLFTNSSSKRFLLNHMPFIRSFLYTSVVEIRTIHLASYFSGKLRDPSQNKRSKTGNGFGGHYNLRTFSGICNSNRMTLPFPDAFDELLFLYAYLFLPKSVSSTHHRTNTNYVGILNSPNISSKWILNPRKDWGEMQICD